MNLTENFKDINGFEGLYQISDFGNVKSLPKIKGAVWQNEIILRPKKTNKGYLSVGLSKNNKMDHRLIHRLVAQAFISNPENKPEVNHKNGIKSCNYAWNLEWNTRKENENHARKTGLKILHGQNHHWTKLSNSNVEIIKIEYSTGRYSQKYLAERFGVTQSQISKIILNQSRKWV